MRLAIPSLFVIAMTWSVHASTIRVPQEHATIQAALDASQDGDEVIVSPGVYSEIVSINTKVNLRSNFDGQDWSIVENTVIKPPSTKNNLPAVFAGSRHPIIRGFRITREPIPVPPPFPGTRAVGIHGGANVEYCIIENQVNMPSDGNGSGGAILNSSGTIQNNIIRNNHAEGGSAFYGCSGTIRNNVIHQNGGIPIGFCSGKILNNTLHNNGGGLGFCTGEISNNIIWWDTNNDVPGIGGSSTPNYCLIKDYNGPGVGNINADPQFVNPTAADFRLKADSPAIDAGLTTGGLKADIKGVQRGLKGVPQLRGDGSAVDIGAFEFIPEPVGVWLPGGGPDLIESGDILTVSWKQTETAGTAILLRLMAQGVPVVDYGAFYSPTSQAEQNLPLPSSLPTHDSYWIQARSSFNPSLTSNTPFFRIQNPQNGIPHATWTLYP